VLTLLLSGLSGWLLLVLLGATTAMPRVLGRAGGAATGPALMTPRPNGRRAGYLERLWPHYWAGAAIGGLVVVHAWVAMSGTLARRVDATGLDLATAALVAILVQLSIGLRLRHPARPDRRSLRRVHRGLVVLNLVLVAGHVLLDTPGLAVLRVAAG